MNTTKALKKKFAPPTPIYHIDPALDEALLVLEDICASLLEQNFAQRDDSERMYWQQRFKNIVTPISLALTEVRGPRRFHHHYRHDSNDDSVLLPVLENPLEMLGNACRKALNESSRKLAGIHDNDLLAAQRRLEISLNNFLLKYNK